MTEHAKTIRGEAVRLTALLEKALAENMCEMASVSWETEIKGKMALRMLNGYWVWWCYKHNQPYAWCEKDRAVIKAKIEALNWAAKLGEKRIKKIDGVKYYTTYEKMCKEARKRDLRDFIGEEGERVKE